MWSTHRKQWSCHSMYHLNNSWTSSNQTHHGQEEVLHLGIKCSIRDQNIVVNDRTSTARKTFDAMNSSGVYGQHGLHISTSNCLSSSYVIPRFLYGLEVVKIKCTGRDKLETFHSFALKCILELPKWTATLALYILTEQLPINYQLDIKIPNFVQGVSWIQSLPEKLY